MIIINLIAQLISVLLAVAFFTLMERKFLGYHHIRKGPNKPGPAGSCVPFADAIKLFIKENNYPKIANRTLFTAVLLMVFFIPSILWMVYPSLFYRFASPISFIVFLAFSSLGVYGTLGVGYRSNSKYSNLGSVRAIAQTISYEVCLSLFLLSRVIFSSLSLNFFNLIPPFVIIPLRALIFFIIALAETNRSPFDFAEGERELVSGFNTEYSSIPFVVVFLAEYIAIILISIVTRVTFIQSTFTARILPILLVSIRFIWARGTLPRFRYDQLIIMAWKCLLPFSLAIISIIVVIAQ